MWKVDSEKRRTLGEISLFFPSWPTRVYATREFSFNEPEFRALNEGIVAARRRHVQRALSTAPLDAAVFGSLAPSSPTSCVVARSGLDWHYLPAQFTRPTLQRLDLAFVVFRFLSLGALSAISFSLGNEPMEELR